MYIIGHVPPGFFEKTRNKAWFREGFNEEYLKVVRRHHRVIAGQFFGHHHTDSFRMFYDSAGTHPGGQWPAHFPLSVTKLSVPLSLSWKVPPSVSCSLHLGSPRGKPRYLEWSTAPTIQASGCLNMTELR